MRLVEVHAELPAVAVKVEELPKDAASALGKATLNDRSPSGRIQGSEGQNVRFRQFARQVDAALRPVLSGRETPLILAATGSARRRLSRRKQLSEPAAGRDRGQPGPDQRRGPRRPARPVLDAAHAAEFSALKALYEAHAGDGRATCDLSDAARAATYGAIETLLVDMDAVVPGTVDEQSGAITFAEDGRSRQLTAWSTRLPAGPWRAALGFSV